MTSATELTAYHELCAYTLSLRDPAFIHQHVVDAFAAQNADEQTKPITLTFALIGLYLHVEKHVSGKQVQAEHMRLARYKRTWPALKLPRERGSIRVGDVIAAAEGPARDRMIHEWAASVWNAFAANREILAALVS